MNQDTPHSHLLSNIECKKSDLNKLAKKVGKRIFHRDRNSMFVPSTSAQPGSESVLQYTNSANHTPIQGLTIDCEGGETSGQSFGWLADEFVDDAERVRRAQCVGLDMVKHQIRVQTSELERLKRELTLLNEVFVENCNIPMETDIQSLEKKYRELKAVEQDIRKRNPTSIRPPRPPPPRRDEANTHWQCIRCTTETPTHTFRCSRCFFPRPQIDPREAHRCGCVHCCKVIEGKQFVSLTDGDDDWTLVEKFSSFGMI